MTACVLSLFAGYGDTCACGSKVKSRRLSCRFDEWLMGLPAGWITDVPGVTRTPKR